MTQEPPKRNGNVQLNLNTVLLAICVGLSSWALKSIEDLKTQMAGQVPIINANSAAIMNVNSLDKEQSDKLEAIDNRLTTLEAIIAQTKK
jgi:hypothetical protein